MSQKPLISIIIPARNEEENIGECLDSIRNQTYKKKEIIVIDGGSTDRTVEIARKKGAVVLMETGKYRCPANAWNQGTEHAKSNLICILGSDFLLPNDFMEKVVKQLSIKDVASIHTRIKTTRCTLIERIAARDGWSTHSNVFKKDMWEEIGHFPIIGFGEDNIFAMRIKKYVKKHGMKEIYLSNTYYGGHTVHDLKELYKQGKWYGRTSVLYLREFYKESKNLMQLLKEVINVNLRLIYTLSFILFIIFSFTSFRAYFSIPFLILFFLTILKNVTIPYKTLKVFTNLVFGFGFLVGLLSFLTGINRERGRT